MGRGGRGGRGGRVGHLEVGDVGRPGKERPTEPGSTRRVEEKGGRDRSFEEECEIPVDFQNVETSDGSEGSVSHRRSRVTQEGVPGIVLCEVWYSCHSPRRTPTEWLDRVPLTVSHDLLPLTFLRLLPRPHETRDTLLRIGAVYCPTVPCGSHFLSFMEEKSRC